DEDDFPRAHKTTDHGGHAVAVPEGHVAILLDPFSHSDPLEDVRLRDVLERLLAEARQKGGRVRRPRLGMLRARQGRALRRKQLEREERILLEEGAVIQIDRRERTSEDEEAVAFA